MHTTPCTRAAQRIIGSSFLRKHKDLGILVNKPMVCRNLPIGFLSNLRSRDNTLGSFKADINAPRWSHWVNDAWILAAECGIHQLDIIMDVVAIRPVRGGRYSLLVDRICRVVGVLGKECCCTRFRPAFETSARCR